MKVQLYNPPVHHYAGQHYFMNPPLSLPIISAVLNNAGISCEVVDLEAIRINPNALSATYRGQYGNWPDAIGFTITHFNRRGARDCIGNLRNIGYDGYIAIGGAEVTALPDEFQDWQVDAIVVGECEGNVVGIFQEGQTGDWPSRRYKYVEPWLSSPLHILCQRSLWPTED
jgi:radical SAM superfamily enzyme YgiQ (UPF0313 family)